MLVYINVIHFLTEKKTLNYNDMAVVALNVSEWLEVVEGHKVMHIYTTINGKRENSVAAVLDAYIYIRR